MPKAMNKAAPTLKNIKVVRRTLKKLIESKTDTGQNGGGYFILKKGDGSTIRYKLPFDDPRGIHLRRFLHTKIEEPSKDAKLDFNANEEMKEFGDSYQFMFHVCGQLRWKDTMWNLFLTGKFIIGENGEERKPDELDRLLYHTFSPEEWKGLEKLDELRDGAKPDTVEERNTSQRFPSKDGPSGGPDTPPGPSREPDSTVKLSRGGDDSHGGEIKNESNATDNGGMSPEIRGVAVQDIVDQICPSSSPTVSPGESADLPAPGEELNTYHDGIADAHDVHGMEAPGVSTVDIVQHLLEKVSGLQNTVDKQNIMLEKMLENQQQQTHAAPTQGVVSHVAVHEASDDKSKAMRRLIENTKLESKVTHLMGNGGERSAIKLPNQYAGLDIFMYFGRSDSSKGQQLFFAFKRGGEQLFAKDGNYSFSTSSKSTENIEMLLNGEGFGNFRKRLENFHNELDLGQHGSRRTAEVGELSPKANTPKRKKVLRVQPRDDGGLDIFEPTPQPRRRATPQAGTQSRPRATTPVVMDPPPPRTSLRRAAHGQRRPHGKSPLNNMRQPELYNTPAVAKSHSIGKGAGVGEAGPSSSGARRTPKSSAGKSVGKKNRAPGSRGKGTPDGNVQQDTLTTPVAVTPADTPSVFLNSTGEGAVAQRRSGRNKSAVSYKESTQERILFS